MNLNHDSQNMRDLEPLLLKAVQAVLSDTPTDEAVSRVVDRAKRLQTPTSGRPTTTNVPAPRTRTRPPRQFLAWSASAAAAIAAALVLALFLISGGTSVSFAEMMAAVASRPWIHATTTYSAGGQNAKAESWVSTAHRFVAIKFGDRRQFEDLKAGVSQQYDTKDGVIYRVPLLRISEGRFTEAQLPSLLDRLISDQTNSRDLFYGERVVIAERHEAEQNGRHWLDYLIHLERIDNASLNRTVRIQLDRATQLPEMWEERKADGSVAVTRFDYPNRGPQDIYALDVPKTAKLIDRVPQGELAQIAAAQEAGRRQFDAYDAIVVDSTVGATTNYDQLLNLSVKRVRRKGGQYRVDQLLTAKEVLVAPAPGTNMQQWWQENRDRYWSVPQLICDGQTAHLYKMLDDRLVPGKKPNLSVVDYKQMPICVPTNDSPVEWPQLMPEQCSRPHLWASDTTREFDVDAKSNDGPQGTVRVVITTKSKPRSGELFRYWFDPGKDYILRKEISAVFDSHTNELDYLDTEEFEDFAQSPSGKWYPRLVRRTTSNDPRWQGVAQFFIDFQADLDADLFRPVAED